MSEYSKVDVGLSKGFGSDEEDIQVLEILNNLEQKIFNQPWIFGKLVSLLDISILPFIL